MGTNAVYLGLSVLLLVVLAFADEDRVLYAANPREIPKRCIENSVTGVSCVGDVPDSLLPHPDDCELFYYCVAAGARPVCRQCPARLHFNPDKRVCDHPEAAGCVANNATVNT